MEFTAHMHGTRRDRAQGEAEGHEQPFEPSFSSAYSLAWVRCRVAGAHECLSDSAQQHKFISASSNADRSAAGDDDCLYNIVRYAYSCIVPAVYSEHTPLRHAVGGTFITHQQCSQQRR